MPGERFGLRIRRRWVSGRDEVSEVSKLGEGGKIAILTHAPLIVISGAFPKITLELFATI